MMIQKNNQVLADSIRPADSFLTRFIGLMGKKTLQDQEGLLLFHCSCIHCFFMRFPIDAVYLSAEMKVVGIETLKPWRLGHFFKGAKHVLELPEGFAAGKIAVGDLLKITTKDAG